ncbi:MAG: ABC transporter permease [Acidobacteria bacterium]|nr:ABC transporter permease [Acidobacteriota bacterium]
MRSLALVGLIAGREIRSYFLQPLAWVVLTVLLAFNGYAFSSIVSLPGISSAPALEIQRFLFTTLLFWFPLLVFLPVVAMRLVAEERHSGTLETLLTAPVTENQVTLGKYLAALFFYIVMTCPFVLYLGLLDVFGEVDWRAGAAGLLGLWVIGAYLLAVCLCASSLTKNQIVAAIIGFVAALFLYVAPLLAQILARADAWRDVWDYFNLITSMEDFSKGLIDSRRLLYPLTGTVFFLFATARLIEAAKGR